FFFCFARSRRFRTPAADEEPNEPFRSDVGGLRPHATSARGADYGGKVKSNEENRAHAREKFLTGAIGLTCQYPLRGPLREGKERKHEAGPGVTPTQVGQHAVSRTKCPRLDGISQNAARAARAVLSQREESVPTGPFGRTVHGNCLTRWQGESPRRPAPGWPWLNRWMSRGGQRGFHVDFTLYGRLDSRRGHPTGQRKEQDLDETILCSGPSRKGRTHRDFCR